MNDMVLGQIYAGTKKELKTIEKYLEMALEAPHPLLHEAGLELLRAGGKRIRPMLALMASRYGDPGRPEVSVSAVMLELIHMASLVHDDVVDNSELRRGRPTVKAKWDNRVAIFTGDYIFACAIKLISAFDHPEAHRQISRVIRDLSLGEIDQIRHLRNWKQNLRTYLRRIKRKTAILMALSCQLGAMAAGCDTSLSRKLYYYGYFLGMSYQITDDILDFVGNERQLGKPAGSDLRNGNITLPVFYALRNPELHDAIVSVLTEAEPSDDDWDDVIGKIRDSQAIEEAQALSDRYLRKAEGILDELPDQKVTGLLREMTAYVGERKY